MPGTGAKNRILLLTGRLAAPSIQCVAEGLKGALDVSVLELPISVAALMTPEWALGRILSVGNIGTPDRIVIPGRVAGDLRVMEDSLGIPVVRGPEDLWDLPEWLGLDLRDTGGRDEFDGAGFRIIAEITEAWRMPVSAVVAAAETFRRDGADYVDLGGSPDSGVPDVEGKIAALKARGFLVSVDTFHRETIIRASEAGADMILSVNASNMDLLERGSVKCPVVVIPDYERDESDYAVSLGENIKAARRAGATVIADPILAPPLMGFVRSLCRFCEYRSLHPDVPMLMGAGNATELLEADSAGVNALLAVCVQELGIDYVLTTEVARWTRGTVRELKEARRIMRVASRRGTLPKRISQALRELKGPPARYGMDALREMQSSLTDANWRIFAAEGEVCAFNRGRFLHGKDVAKIFAGMEITDPSHAFYLGREFEKAATALSLDRNYVQDDALSWGVLSEFGGAGERP
jgi:dihydropteroate synthase-like protein